MNFPIKEIKGQPAPHHVTLLKLELEAFNFTKKELLHREDPAT